MGRGMGLDKVVTSIRDTLTTRKVYAEPVERDGVTVIPAMAVIDAGGGGSGAERDRDREGEGGGFMLLARPVGAFVIKDGDARWVPAIDLTLLGAVLAITVAAIHKVRRRHRAGAKSA